MGVMDSCLCGWACCAVTTADSNSTPPPRWEKSRGVAAPNLARRPQTGTRPWTALATLHQARPGDSPSEFCLEEWLMGLPEGWVIDCGIPAPCD